MQLLNKAARKALRLAGLSRPLIPDATGQRASDLIRNLIERPSPCMIGRFGSNELDATLTFLAAGERNLLKRAAVVLQGGDFDWNKPILTAMNAGAGFFPAEKRYLEQFAQLMLRDAHCIDVLGSWLPGERLLGKPLSNAKIIRLKDLEPYYHRNPWTAALQDRKVLVISPFAASIQTQYEQHRAALFADERILPRFQLQTLCAVQSIGESGQQYRFKTWFDALDWMCGQIDSLDFEVGIIGAGAYGLPLAAHIKRQGRKAIHLGGATQILFGIKGKRWDESEFFQSLYNRHWVRPSALETPAGANQVEGGCYW